MFFKADSFRSNINDKDPSKAKRENEKESSSEADPTFFVGPEGETIINDPSLLLSKEVHKSPPSSADEEYWCFNLFVFNRGWTPYGYSKYQNP